MRFLFSAALLLSVFSFVGCEHKPNGERSHSHDAKVKYDSPAAELKGVLGNAIAATQAIRDAAEKGDVDAAHDELHGIGGYLEALPNLAKAASLDAAQTESLTKVAKSLFDTMSKIDEALHHGGKDFKFSDVQESFDRDFAELKTLGESIGK